MTTPASVAQLLRYPVKSMLGEDLPAAELTPHGLLGDRGYALVATSDGTVASGKHPQRWRGLLAWSARYVDEPVAGEALPPVELTAPDGSVLRSDAPGTDDALSRALGCQVRLSCEPVAGARFEEVWPDIDGLAPAGFIRGTTTGASDTGEPLSALALGMLLPQPSFQDLSALHLITTATLAHLSRLDPEGSFDARRYRPNVLVDDGGDGFVEDAWVGRQVQVGAARAAVTMLTMRCVMTTLAQGDLPEDRGTLRTLARTHRRDIPGLGTWACAGVYADVVRPGMLRVGDPVEVAAPPVDLPAQPRTARD